MRAATYTEQGLITLPLENAVLCVDCEMVSNSHHDVCVVCGSRSLLSLVRTLGGMAGHPKGRFTENREKNRVRYDLDLELHVRDLAATDLNAVIETVTRLQSPAVGGLVEHLRINVESLVEHGIKMVRKAA